MHFDFSAFLVLGTALTGLVWLGYVLRKRWSTGEDGPVAEPVLVEYARSFFPVLLIVLVLRSFIVEPFRIPSSSMMPSLLIGDFILVNKFAYGIRLPVIHAKVFDNGLPERGDVVVFRYPKDPSLDYIKRVIGVPGDHIAYYNKQLVINGETIDLEKIGSYQGLGQGRKMTGAIALQEQLNEHAHDVLITPNRPSLEGQFVVPQGQYFVMGDNRDNSNDSRYWGAVPEENLVGKAFMIWMNWDGGIAWNRIGSTIQ